MGAILKNGFFVLALFASFCSDAAACSCPVKSFGEFVKEADAIYFATLEEAKVIRSNSDRKWPFIQGRFEVRRTLKGAPRARVMMLSTGLGGGDCGVPMSVSQIYIIFKKSSMEGIHNCDGSHAIYDFEEDKIVAKVKRAMNKNLSKQ